MAGPCTMAPMPDKSSPAWATGRQTSPTFQHVKVSHKDSFIWRCVRRKLFDLIIMIFGLHLRFVKVTISL